MTSIIIHAAMKITYRRAAVNDYQVLYDLSVEFEKFNKQHTTRPHEHFLYDWQDYFREEILGSLKKRGSYVFLAFVDSNPAGYVYARVCRGCYAFIIEELFVRDQYSKMGIGGELLSMAIKKGKTFDYDIKVEVFDWNTSALEYYRKRGFFIESYVLKLNSSSGSAETPTSQ